MGITDADRLDPDDGPKIALSNGTRINLYFGYRGLKLIEKHYQSFAKFTKALQDTNEAQFTAMLDGISFATWRSGVTLEKLEEELDPQELDQHMEALSEALVRSFPKETKKAAEAAPLQSSYPQETPSETLRSIALLNAFEESPRTSNPSQPTGEPTTTPPQSSSTVSVLTSGT